jgi:hypothetical protein
VPPAPGGLPDEPPVPLELGEPPDALAMPPNAGPEPLVPEEPPVAVTPPFAIDFVKYPTSFPLSAQAALVTPRKAAQEASMRFIILLVPGQVQKGHDGGHPPRIELRGRESE